MGSRSKVSSAIFIAAVLSFLLPFVSVSCGGQKIVTFSGAQLATGTSVDQPGMFGAQQKKNVDPEPLVSLAAVCAIVGLVMSLVGGAKAALGPAISGGVGALLLLLLQAKMGDQIAKQGQGMLQVSYEAGYTLTLLLLITGAAVNGYVFFSQRARSAAPNLPDAPRPPGELTGPTVSAPPELQGVCPHCGSPSQEVSKFCANCGKPLSAGAAATQSGS